MQRILFLLAVMGQVFFSSCRLYEYHLINEGKTWKDAQKFCRDKYTDLATLFNMTDLMSLKDLMEENVVPAAWIGLQSKQREENRKWHWSLPGIPEEKFDDLMRYFCKPKSSGNGGNNKNAANEFICFNVCVCVLEFTESKESIEVTEKMKWKQAQKYCKKYRTDLISGRDQLRKFCKSSQNKKWWIGLFRDTWRWSDGSNSSFRNWKKFEDGVNKLQCAAVLKSSGDWSADDCENKKPFFCYDDKVVLVTEKLTWDQAVDHCREHYHDLVSITNTYQQRWVQARARHATTDHVWLGLRYTCTMDLWFWINDHLVCYSNWKEMEESEDECDFAAAMEKAGANEWVKRRDTETYNFICARKEA